jgi:sialic acid synthase SpsE
LSTGTSGFICNKRIGPGKPAYAVAEAGINHEVDLELAEQLISVAVAAGTTQSGFKNGRAKAPS